MPTIKLELFKSKTLVDGRHPVNIKVHHLKPARKTIASAFPDEFIGRVDKCLKGSSAAIRQKNIDIDDEFTRYSNIFKELVRSGKKWKPEDVFAAADQPENAPVYNFWQIADLYLATQTGYSKTGMAGVVNKFKTYLGNDSLRLSDIDSGIIDKYIHFMRTVPQRNGKPNKESTIKKNLKVLRFISTFGSKNKYDTRPEDLHNFKLPREGETNIDFLTKEELARFANAQVDGPVMKEAQQAFLLAVYLRGMRIGDIILLKQSYFNAGRLKYTTIKNNKEMDMALVGKAHAIVAELLDGREYLFRFFKWVNNPALSADQNDTDRTNHIKAITANINNKLKKIAKKAGIDKNLRTHISRHSFTNIADGENMDLAVVQALLGHGSRAMTEKYIKKIRKSEVLDAAVKDIFGD